MLILKQFLNFFVIACVIVSCRTSNDSSQLRVADGIDTPNQEIDSRDEILNANANGHMCEGKLLKITDYPTVRIIDFHGLQDGIVKNRPEIGRMGTYWTIGSPFNPELDGGAGAVGDPNIAIIAPLKYLLGQAVNLSCFDTMILGELDLRSLPGVTILIPKNTKVDLGDLSSLTVVEYNVPTVHQAVKSFLLNRFPEYALEFHERGKNQVALDKQGHDLSKFHNFQSLLAAHPYISFGWTDNSVGGLNSLIQAAGDVFHAVSYYDIHNHPEQPYVITGLAGLVPILRSSFLQFKGKINDKMIKAALDLADMALSKLKTWQSEPLSSEGFRELSLEDRIDIIYLLSKRIGEIDPQSLYATTHWAHPYTKIIMELRKASKERILGISAGMHKFESFFDPQLAAAIQSSFSVH